MFHKRIVQKPTIRIPSIADCTPTPAPSPAAGFAQQATASYTISPVGPIITRRPPASPSKKAYTHAWRLTAEAEHQTAAALNLIDQKIYKPLGENELLKLHFLLIRIANDNLEELTKRARQAALLRAMSTQVNKQLKELNLRTKPIIPNDHPTTPIGLKEILTAVNNGFNQHK
jgi:hypothetical protein